MRRKAILLLALLALAICISANQVQPASATGVSYVINPEFEDNGGSYNGWSQRNLNPLNWGATFSPQIITRSALDNSQEPHQYLNLGHVAYIYTREEGGFPTAGVETVMYQSMLHPVNRLTTIYGLMSAESPGSQMAKGAMIGVSICCYNGGGTYVNVGDLDYYVSNVGLGDTSNHKFVCVAQYTLPGQGGGVDFHGISDGYGSGRRLLSDIIWKFYNNKDPGLTFYVSEVHIGSFIWSNWLGEDFWGIFKDVYVGEYPSPTLAISNTAVTRDGWGGLPTSTRLQITSDGAAPSYPQFPASSYFYYSQASFRGAPTHQISLSGASSYSWSTNDVTVSAGNIAQGTYQATGTTACADGIGSGSSSQMVNGYTFHISTSWTPNAQGTATLTYQQNGQTSNAYLASSAADAYVIVDPGSTASISQQPYSVPTERTITYDARSWYGISYSQTVTVNYLRQFKVTVNPLDYRDAALGRTINVNYLGDNGAGVHGNHTTATSAAWSQWLDDGSVVRIGKMTADSTLQEEWYSYNGTLNGNWRTLPAVTTPEALKLVYYDQFRMDLELMTSQYGGSKVYDNCSFINVGDWVRGCAWLQGSEIDARPSSVGAFTFKWITPSGQIIHTDNLQNSNCYTNAFQIPETYGEWKLQTLWNDGTALVYNNTMSFYVYGYNLQDQVQEDTATSNINLTTKLSSIGGTDTPSHSMLVAVTTGTTATSYTRNLNLLYGGGLAETTSLSTPFFATRGAGTVWSAHIINLDPKSAHQVAFVVRVCDPITGYIYMNISSGRLLGIGAQTDLTLPFIPSSSWWRYGLFRVTYTFYIYDALGVNLLGSSVQDFGNTDPLSWIMRGIGIGDIKAIYYVTDAGGTSISTQIPVSVLSSSVTASFYIAWEDCHALSTQSQVTPVIMRYLNITFQGGNVFATGCVPPPTWVQDGTNITLSVESPFYPKPPYYSSTTRFIFLGWKWTYTQSPQWVSCNTTTTSVNVTQPLLVVACWRTQYLIEYTPYVPTTAPTDIVQLSYVANAALTNITVRSASTVRVWVDAYTLFTMQDLWVNDYTWYGVNYDIPSKNATGGAILTLPYIEKTNRVSSMTVGSNSFEAGGTLNLNLTLTTTYFNAQWINVTVIVASTNAVLVDRNGISWSDMRVQLQNNTALLTVPLPADIGNGTLTVVLTAYGKVEPTARQVTLRSPIMPPPPGQGQQQGGFDLIQGAVTVGLLVAFVGVCLSISKWRRAGRQGADRSTNDATDITTTATAISVNWVPIINSLSGAGIIEFDEQKGPYLKTIIDKESKFLGKLRDDPGMCNRHHGLGPVVIQDQEGEQVALTSYTRYSRSKSRTVKSTLVLCTKEPSGDSLSKLGKELSQRGNYRSIRLKLISPSGTS